MSRNLALVRSILADWETGDFRSVDWADPHIEYAIADEPGAQVAFGLAAMRHRWRDFLSAWEDYRIEAREYIELDGERVLVAHAARGRGKTSGLEIGATTGGRETANLFHLRGGRVTRLVSYFDRDRAFADAGIAAANRPAARAA